MRLIFLYYSQSQNPGEYQRNYTRTENKFALNFPTEGLYKLFKTMVDAGVISECITFIESVSSPGKVLHNEGMSVYVIQNINEVKDYIQEGDIVFVRGGWKRWFPFLQWMERHNLWMLLYAANTGRQKWDLWDIVLDDITMKNRTDPKGRNWISYPKPVNEDIFSGFAELPYANRKYDFMIGASHIHDKKGQWKAINALRSLQLTNVPFRAILPGSGRRGVHSNKINDTVTTMLQSQSNEMIGPIIEVVGEVSREVLANYMNDTKVFVHAGSGGQHDRGPIEAMACGCRLVVASPTYHSPFVTAHRNITHVPENAENPNNLARTMLESLGSKESLSPMEICRFARKTYGVREASFPLMVKLFDVFKDYPYRNIAALRKAFGIGTI